MCVVLRSQSELCAIYFDFARVNCVRYILISSEFFNISSYTRLTSCLNG